MYLFEDQCFAECMQMQSAISQLHSACIRRNIETFMANRSLSTSAAAKSPFARWRQNRNNNQICSDQRSNRSHDDLSRLGESMDEESLLGGTTGDSCASSLQRMVDELTQKCHKSITLLKRCNQSGLSASVEQLLVRVNDHVGETKVNRGTNEDKTGENISDRLERLSSAFDAIQRYLEEQTMMSSSLGSLTALTGEKMPLPAEVERNGGTAGKGKGGREKTMKNEDEE